MDQIQASLQLTLAAGGRVLVLVGEKPPRLKTAPPRNINIVNNATEALFLIKRAGHEIVICAYPDFCWFIESLSAEEPVSVMMTVPPTASRKEAVQFARQIRNCAVLPASFSLESLLQGGILDEAEGVTTRYLRRLPRLTALWARRKTGVVDFIQRDGAWDSISLKGGGLVQTGDIKIIRGALQTGKIRFTERAVAGDPSHAAMGRLLLELGGLHANTRFAGMYRDWVFQGGNPGNIPISSTTRRLCAAADGATTLRTLLTRMGIREQAVSEELHALTRLRLIQFQPPDSYALQPLHRRLRHRLTLDHALLHATQKGLGSEAAPMMRKIARWQEERYARLSEDPELPPSLQDEAEEISDVWRQIFADGGVREE